MGVPEMSAELTNEIARLSQKAVAGTASDEELRRGLALLRQDRMSIKPGGAKKAPLDSDKELDDLLS